MAGIGGGRPIAEKNFDGVFEQDGAGRFGGIVLNGDCLTFEAS
jgi:hypothetical protein